jgi:hypothetical protein
VAPHFEQASSISKFRGDFPSLEKNTSEVDTNESPGPSLSHTVLPRLPQRGQMSGTSTKSPM